ncbi:hypothetical protein SAMN05216466_103172 [Paraburkholderia phenazinium]|jgi:hypothetical protein|uniref:Uncharacterized protein n=1 Tax=Paraburkholderia phenazinium TaxID=60549 RepID=A0A1G7TVK2_9BURK|nr:hypothetical protein [Paraburkholderia phenazinium]SDG39054.1 hypothetical protein SAMN05216466_103172 [Paraburkholderia phenazinium]
MTCGEFLNPLNGMQLYVFRQDLFGSARGVRAEFNASGFETQVNREPRVFNDARSIEEW